MLITVRAGLIQSIQSLNVGQKREVLVPRAVFNASATFIGK